MSRKKSLIKANISKARKLSKQNLSRSNRGTTFKLGDLFSFSTKGTAKNNFSSSLEYKNFMVDLKGTVKNGKAKLNVKIDGKSFSFKCEIIMGERTFKELFVLFEHLLSNLGNR